MKRYTLSAILGLDADFVEWWAKQQGIVDRYAWHPRYCTIDSVTMNEYAKAATALHKMSGGERDAQYAQFQIELGE